MTLSPNINKKINFMSFSGGCGQLIEEVISDFNKKTIIKIFTPTIKKIAKDVINVPTKQNSGTRYTTRKPPHYFCDRELPQLDGRPSRAPSGSRQRIWYCIVISKGYPLCILRHK